MANKFAASQTTTDADRDCAVFARAALFPPRMHRDVSHATQLPALLQLDTIRHNFLAANPNASSNELFPKRVVVVRALDDETDIQWNGHPDINKAEASFEVIPKQLIVKATSTCDSIAGMMKTQRAFLKQTTKETELVLCTDRLLQSDYKEPLDNTVAKDLPPKTLSVVEEVVAHYLVLLQQQQQKEKQQISSAPAQIAAAKAAECYYSSHLYPGTKKAQIRKGSGLPTGFSLLPKVMQTMYMNKCIYNTAVTGMMQHASSADMTKAEASKAVKEAMK